MAKGPVAGCKKYIHNINKISFSIDSFERPRDCNATLKVKVVLVRALKTCKGS